MKQLETFKKAKHNLLATDKDDNLVFLAETTFLLQMAERDYPDITFHKTSEFMLDK
jgi:peptide chain release factor 3